jgi:hypothetical protein
MVPICVLLIVILLCTEMSAIALTLLLLLRQICPFWVGREEGRKEGRKEWLDEDDI